MSEKLPRCPGFKYSPKVHSFTAYYDGPQFRVQQMGFWQDGAVCGPYKSTEAQAIKAWKRLVKRLTSRDGGK